jgi:hypothetical protein
VRDRLVYTAAQRTICLGLCAYAALEQPNEQQLEQQRQPRQQVCPPASYQVS